MIQPLRLKHSASTVLLQEHESYAQVSQGPEWQGANKEGTITPDQFTITLSATTQLMTMTDNLEKGRL
jgi:hypothetical protein